MTHGPAAVSWPALSPDGTMIAHAGKDGLFVLDVTSGESTQIADGTNRWSQPQFTPDGTSVIYTGGSGAAASDRADRRREEQTPDPPGRGLDLG